jgi:ubiquinone/menaquinone biosynthesis C-methylase UbiE
VHQGAVYWDVAYQSGRYSEYWEFSHPSPELAAALATGIARQGEAALDLGCGSGQDAILLAQHGLNAVGVDISAAALRLARLRAESAGVEVEWRQGDVLRLPLPDESIDFANDRGCFHHLPDAQRIVYGREVMRVLRPRGRLLLRGSAKTEFPFYEVSTASIERAFGGTPYRCGPVLPLALVTDRGTLAGRIALVDKV